MTKWMFYIVTLRFWEYSKGHMCLAECNEQQYYCQNVFLTFVNLSLLRDHHSSLSWVLKCIKFPFTAILSSWTQLEKKRLKKEKENIICVHSNWVKFSAAKNGLGKSQRCKMCIRCQCHAWHRQLPVHKSSTINLSVSSGSKLHWYWNTSVIMFRYMLWHKTYANTTQRKNNEKRQNMDRCLPFVSPKAFSPWKQSKVSSGSF